MSSVPIRQLISDIAVATLQPDRKLQVYHAIDKSRIKCLLHRGGDRLRLLIPNSRERLSQLEITKKLSPTGSKLRRQCVKTVLQAPTHHLSRGHKWYYSLMIPSSIFIDDPRPTMSCREARDGIYSIVARPILDLL